MAIAVPVYNNVTEKAAAAACEANRRSIDGAVLMWQMDQDPPATSVPPENDLDAFWKNYFQNKPECPKGGAYTLSTTGTTCSEHGEEDGD
jgi:hypothetical protein